MKKILIIILMVLLNFCIESFLECISEYIRYEYAPLEYSSVYKPLFLNTVGAFLMIKAIFWSVPYIILYYIFLNNRVSPIKFSLLNLIFFWISALTSTVLFADIVFRMLGLDAPISIYSKFIHSSIIAIISGIFIVKIFRLKIIQSKW